MAMATRADEYEATNGIGEFWYLGVLRAFTGDDGKKRNDDDITWI